MVVVVFYGVDQSYKVHFCGDILNINLINLGSVHTVVAIIMSIMRLIVHDAEGQDTKGEDIQC